MATIHARAPRPVWTLVFNTPSNTPLTLTDQAQALQFLANSTRMQQVADLTGYNDVRFTVRVFSSSASANTPKVILRYATTFSTTVTDYIDIGTSEVSVSLAATGMIQSAWVPLASGARGPVFLTVAQSGGDGVADPSVASVTAQFR